MIIWGGWTGSGVYLDTGARHNGLDFWMAATPTSDAPEPRMWPTMVRRLYGGAQIVWGGVKASTPYNSLNTGAILDVSASTWTVVPTTNAPAGRHNHSAIFSYNAEEMVVWGGYTDSSPHKTNTGGRYSLNTNAWTSMTTTNAPSARELHRALDISDMGIQMIVWGGWDEALNCQNTGGVYSVCSSYAPDLQSSPVSATDLDSCSQGIRIIWKDALHWNDGGYGTRSFEIYRDGNLLKTSSYTGSATYAIVDVDTVAGTTYTYYVRYNNGCGNSKNSGTVTAVDTITGSAPTGLTAPSVTADSDLCQRNKLTISWAQDPVNWNDSGGLYQRQYGIYLDGIKMTDVPYGMTSIELYFDPTNITHSVTVVYRNACYFSSSSPAAQGIDYERTLPVVGTIIATDASGCEDSGVTVTWPADPISWGDNGSTTGSRIYLVYRNGSMISDGIAYGTTSFTDTSGTNGTSYNYAVEYINACGRRMTTATAAAADLLPSAPSSLTNNTAADLSVCNDTGVQVTWTVDPGSWGDSGTGTRTYTVLRNGAAIPTGGCSGNKAYGTANCTDVTGTNWTSYTYTVRYNNGCGLNATTAGATATDLVTSAPTAVNNAAADVSACDDTGVSITWSAPSNWNDNGSGTRYIDVLRGGTPIATALPATTTSYSDTTGTNGTSYLYQVRFWNGCSFSTTTIGASATDYVSTAPTAANNAAADVSACDDTGVSITWSAPSTWNDNGFGTRTIDVLRDGTAIAMGLAETATSFTDITGTNGTSYTYTVRFNNGCGLSSDTTGSAAADFVAGIATKMIVDPHDESACAYSGVRIDWPAEPTDWGDHGVNPSGRYYQVVRGLTCLTASTIGAPIPYGSPATYLDSTAEPDVSYCYGVYYVNGCGSGRYGYANYAIDVSDTTPCSAVGSTLQMTKSGSNAALSWDAVVCDDLAHYQVYGATTYNAAFPSEWTLLDSPATLTLQDPLSSAFVVYKVSTADQCGNESGD